MAESRRFDRFKRVARIVCYGWLAAWPGIAGASEVTLAWDPSADPQITGYKVYYGNGSRAYTNFVKVGLTNAVTITGLVPGAKYFFAATSVIEPDLESAYSEEAFYVVPNQEVTPPNQPPTLAPIANITIAQNAGRKTLVLSGITSGSALEAQPLTVTATSSAPGLVPNPQVTYESPSAVGYLSFAPVRDASGTANITVVVNDGQASNNLAVRSFTVTVQPVTPALIDLGTAVLQPEAPFSFAVPAPDNNRWTFDFDTQPPPGARLDAHTGVFSWYPGFAHASSTNRIAVRMTNAGDSTRTTLGTLVVIVQDAVRLGLGSTNVMAGQTVRVPIFLQSSEGLASLAFSVDWAPERFSAPSLQLALGGIDEASIRDQHTNLLIQVQAAPGKALQGSNLLGWLSFQTTASQQSGFIELPVTAVGAAKPGASLFANYFGSAGEVAVVSRAPLLRGSTAVDARQKLTVYGTVGVSYQVQYAGKLFPKPEWQPWLNFTQTSPVQTLTFSPAGPLVFYRLVELP